MKKVLYLPNTNLKVKVGTGFNWVVFLLTPFFSPLWYVAKGMISRGFFYFLMALLFSWTLVVPFFIWFHIGFNANKHYYTFLLEKGYREIENDIKDEKQPM